MGFEILHASLTHKKKMIQQIFVETNFLLQEVFVAKFVCCNKFLLQQIFVETNFLLKKLSVSKPQLNLNTTPKQPNTIQQRLGFTRLFVPTPPTHPPTPPQPPRNSTFSNSAILG